MRKIKYIIVVNALLLLSACGSSKVPAYTDAELEEFKSFLESRAYVFKARWANPLASQGLNSIANAGLLAPGNTVGRIDLFSSNNTMEIKGDTVVANLPYYGERRLGVSYNPSDAGIKFEEEPKDFVIAFDEKKQGYTMDFVVNNGTENYNVSGIFFPNRSGRIFVNSTQRQAIGFTGNLVLPEDD